MANFYGDVDQMRKRMLSALPKPEVELIERYPEKLDVFSLAAQESHRNGIDGDAHEWQLYGRDWGFPIEDISIEVKLLYGQYDVQVTPAMGTYYSQTLPNNTFDLVENGGHLSTINNYIDDLLDYLI